MLILNILLLLSYILMFPEKVLAQGNVIVVGSVDELLWSIVKTIQYYSLPVMALTLAGDCGKSLEEFLHMHFNPEMDTKNIDDFYSKYIDREKFQQNYSPLILVKGSQNTIFLEIVVEQILQNKDDTKLLCRRGKFWNSKRKPYTI